MALSAGMIPVISPSAIISASPCSAMVGVTAKAGTMAERLERSAIAIRAANRESRDAAEQRQQHGFAEHHRQDPRARKAERLQHADFAGPLADRQRHGVADDHQDGDEGGPDHQQYDQRDIAELRRERFPERLFGVGRGLCGGIGEHRVDRLRHPVVVFRRGGLQIIQPMVSLPNDRVSSK